WEEVCLAAEQHDVGMAAWDAAPELNSATGLPYSFWQLPRRTRLALWARGPRTVLSQSRYAALLVSLHGTGLYERNEEPGGASSPEGQAVRSYLAGEHAFQEEL